MALDKVVGLLNAKTVLRSFGLTGYDIAVLVEIASHENQEERRKFDQRVEAGEITFWHPDFHGTYSYASVFVLADDTGFSYSTVRKSLANLVDRRVLMQVKQKKRRRIGTRSIPRFWLTSQLWHRRPNGSARS